MIELDRLADAVAGWRTVKIDTARCLPQISPRAHCSDCAAVCPEGAIALGAAPTICDCSGCGLCAANCRADAIVLDNPSDEHLVQRFAALGRKGPRLSLTCQAGPDGPEQVGCLGRLTPELLLAGAACGFTTIELVVGPCDGCRYAKGRAPGGDAGSAAQAVLHHLNHPCQIRRIPAHAWKPDAAKQKTAGVRAPVYQERREFLLSAFGLLRELLPQAAAKALQNEPAAPRLSRRREILRWSLARVGAAGSDFPWGEAGLRLIGRCLHCGVCQRLCPNGAIKVTESSGLQLDPGRCHTCGLCTQVCPVGALSLGAPYSIGNLTAGAPVALGEPAAYRCASCGKPVAATGEGVPLCLACSLRPRNEEVISL